MLNEAVLTSVHKFNWVFDGNDMVLSLEVGVIDDRRQRGVLSRAGRTGTQDKPFLEHGKFFQDHRKTQLIDRQHGGRDEAEDSGNAIFLLEEVRAIASNARHFV